MATPSSTNASPEFSAMAAAFACAASSRGRSPDEVYYRFAGEPVRCRFIGHALSRQIRAPFEHLQSGRTGTDVGLTIDIWDEEETGVACPVPPVPAGWLSWPAAGGTLLASSDGCSVGFQYGDSLTLFDRAGRRVVGCRKTASSLSRYERSKPFVMLLSIWYNDRGLQLLHAGFVARNDCGVLVPGRGGAGKSTSCLLCVCAGFDFLADDFVGLEARSDGSFVGHSLFNTTCLEPRNLARFPSLAGRCLQGDPAVEDKAVLFLAEVFPARVRAEAPVRTIVLPRIVDRPGSRLVPAAKPQALREFAASTLRNVLPRPGAAAMDKMGRLVERLPAYWLELGRDTADVPRQIEDLPG